MNLILTPEQKALRLVQQLHSEDGQAKRYATGIRRVVDAVQGDIAAEGAQPSFKAVLTALADAVADHLALLTDNGTRTVLANAIAEELPAQVARRVEERS